MAQHHGHHHGHHHHHHHHHGHHHAPQQSRVLAISLAIITAFMLVEYWGALWSNSLALLSDAGHMLSDAAALLLALLAVLWAQKRSTPQHTFGWKRLEIMAALLNGLTLLAIAIYIVIEALQRLRTPQEIASLEMLLIASLGLLVNLGVAWYLHRQGDAEQQLNMRAAYLHVLSDLLGSVAAIAAALAMMFWNWHWADAVCSVLVALLIVRGGWQVSRQAWQILLQGNPEVDWEALLRQLRQDERVQDVHDVHVWNLAGSFNVLSCHVVVDERLTVAEITALQQSLEQALRPLGIRHSSLQMESPQHGHAEEALCSLPQTAPGHSH